MIHLLWWHWILILYFGSGFMVCVLATGAMLADFFEQPYDEDSRWWHVPRAYAFCFFLSPGFLMYLICKTIVQDIIEKRKKKAN